MAGEMNGIYMDESSHLSYQGTTPHYILITELID